MHILRSKSFLKKKWPKTLEKKRRFFLTQKLLKVTTYQKLRIAQEIIHAKMSVRSIPIYPTNLATYEES